MRRVLLTTAIILAIQPLLRWGFRFAAPLWWAREAELESLPAQLRCGACRGIGDTHMCEQAPAYDEYEEEIAA